MAEWSVAYNWMMDAEDAQRACRQVVDNAPRGVAGRCFAISGINSGVFPAEFAAIAALPQEKREAAVEAFYHRHFWNQWLAGLNSDELCKRVFDFSVNAGGVEAVRCLQQAIDHSAGVARVAEDGLWGKATVAAANNAADAQALTATFIRLRSEYYRAIVAGNPACARLLPNWLARAER